MPVESIRHVTTNDDARRAIEGGDGILKAIADDLGVLPDFQDSRVCVVLCVEGPTDVEFMKNLSVVVRAADPSLPNLWEEKRIAIVPLGGDTLKDWVNKKYLDEFHRPEMHIYDNDVAKYAEARDAVNRRKDGSWATLTAKREIENYVHPGAVKAAINIDIDVDDACDVPAQIYDVIKKKRINRKSLKRLIAEDVVPRMTLQHLEERGALLEVKQWFTKLKSYLP